MVSHHRIPSSRECRRMMRLKPLEVTRPSLIPSCTSLCNGGKRRAHSLYKGMLIKTGWCLASAPWTTSTPSPSTWHLHMSNDNLIFLSLCTISNAHATTNINHTHFPYTIYQVYASYNIQHNIMQHITHINSSKCTMDALSKPMPLES